MELREQYLSELRDYIDKVESEVTIILQSLQWNRNTLLKPIQSGTCKFNSNHIMPVEKIKEHEEKCYLISKGYSKEDLFLPQPLDASAPTVVKLTTENINNIIQNAAKSDPLFKRGTRNDSEALTFSRLQANFTSDERRAIHDAVIKMVPSSHNLMDLSLASDQKDSKNMQKSREQILAELRDTKRRRPRYRGAPQRNYSHELREVIASQMELLSSAQEKTKYDSDGECDQRSSYKRSNESSRHSSRDRRDHNKERSSDRREDNSDRSHRREDNSGRSHRREERSHKRERRDPSTGSKHDSCDDRRKRDDDHSHRKRDDHHYHRKRDERKSERDSYNSSSRNGKRWHEGEETNDYRARRDCGKRSHNDKNYNYDKYRDKNDRW